jgi:hypothetical protein
MKKLANCKKNKTLWISNAPQLEQPLKPLELMQEV